MQSYLIIISADKFNIDNEFSREPLRGLFLIRSLSIPSKTQIGCINHLDNVHSHELGIYREFVVNWLRTREANTN